MKKALSLILSAVIAASAVISASASYTLTDGSIKKTDTPPLIDGHITPDDNWGDPFITIKNPGTEYLSLCAADHPEYLTDTDLIPSETNIYIRWDDECLYYGATLVQAVRSNTYPAVEYWEGDSLSINIKSTLENDSKTRLIFGLQDETVAAQNETGVYVVHETTEDGGNHAFFNSQVMITRDEDATLTTYEIYFLWEDILPDNEEHPGRTVKAGDVIYLRDLYMPATSPETKNPVDFNPAGITEDGKYNYWKITLLDGGTASVVPVDPDAPTVAITRTTYIEIPKVGENIPVIDGIFDENEGWGEPLVHIDNESFGDYVTDQDDPSHTDTDIKGYYKWDEDNLYFCCVVEDADHYNPDNIELPWKGDSIRFDIKCDTTSDDLNDTTKYWFALHDDTNTYFAQEKAETGLFVVGGDIATSGYKATHDNGVTVYEVAVAWDYNVPFSDVEIEEGFSFITAQRVMERNHGDETCNQSVQLAGYEKDPENRGTKWFVATLAGADDAEVTDIPEVSFEDVSADTYYYDAVQWAVENSITAGTSESTFSPDMTCTRAQAVTFLWRAAGSPEPSSNDMPFTDVAAGSYYYDAVLWAVENGVTSGTSAATFSPDADCTRAQIVTFIWRALLSPTSDSANPFTDVVSDAYYVNAILWAVENGVTAGTSASTFSPDANCTRAQIVTFLYRALCD